MIGVAMYITIKSLWERHKNKSMIARLTGHDWRLNLPRFTGQQDKTIINLMEVQKTWKERKDNLLRNLRKRQ